MTRDEAKDIALCIRVGLPTRLRENVKAMHIMPKLHNGHMTIRIFMRPMMAEDPDPHIFTAEEIIR